MAYYSIFIFKSEYKLSNKNNKCRYIVQIWTSIIYSELWNQLKPCCFAFKNGRINRNLGEIFFQIKRKCTECGAFFNAYT